MVSSTEAENPESGGRELQASNRFSIRHKGPARGSDYEMWREGIWRGFCRLDVSPADEELIDCRNDFTLLHNVALATPHGASARFARTRDLLGDGCDDLVLISASQGKVHVTQGAKVIDLAAGQMCLTEMNIIGAADLTHNAGFTTTRFPRRFLMQVAPTAEAKLARPLGAEGGLSSMINRYLALCSDVAGDLDAVGQKAAAQHLADLVGLLLGAEGGQGEAIRQRGLSSARLELMKADILRNLDRPDLSIEAIARANGMSGRQAQRLFADTGATFSEFVLDQRLLLAQHLLREAVDRPRKIADIAFAAGFSDLSYFNRSFRKRFGLTPSDMQLAFRTQQ